MLHCAHRGSRADGNMPVETLFFLFVFVFKFSAGELSVSGVWKRVDLTAFAHASGPAAARASPAPVRLRASEFKCRRWLCFKPQANFETRPGSSLVRDNSDSKVPKSRSELFQVSEPGPQAHDVPWKRAVPVTGSSSSEARPRLGCPALGRNSSRNCLH
eukprot:371302-Rhodomonas_salina.2